jgi:hypothetical protein
MSGQSLVPLQTIVLYRNGGQVIPPIGVAFEFSDKEVKEIGLSSPLALREPVNEGGARMTPAEIKAEAKRIEAEEEAARKANEAAAADAAKANKPAAGQEESL